MKLQTQKSQDFLATANLVVQTTASAFIEGVAKAGSSKESSVLILKDAVGRISTRFFSSSSLKFARNVAAQFWLCAASDVEFVEFKNGRMTAYCVYLRGELTECFLSAEGSRFVFGKFEKPPVFLVPQEQDPLFGSIGHS